MAVSFNRAAIPDDPSVRLNAFVNFCNGAVAAEPDARRAMSMILDFIVQATEASGAAIAVPDGEVLAVTASTAGSTYARGQRLPANGLAAQVFAQRKTFLANSTIDERADPTRSYGRIGTTVIAPVMQGRRAYGVLLVKHPAAYGIHAKEAHAVSEFASVCGAILGGAFYVEQHADARNTDSATSLRNRRAYEADLAMQMDLNRRFGVPVSVALFASARCGAEALQQWAIALRETIRASDVAYHISEGLFAVLLKNCAEPQAAAARARIAQHLPACSSWAVASPRSGEATRAFRLRLEQALRGKADEHAPALTVWERFTKGIA